MRLATWAALRGWGALSWLSRESGVSYNTIHAIARGARRPIPQTATRIEKATGGAVSAHELLFSDDSDGAPASPKRKDRAPRHGTKAKRTRSRRK
jgi:DNA-binding transcriptional regulator YdaS (Cro superfamily)